MGYLNWQLRLKFQVSDRSAWSTGGDPHLKMNFELFQIQKSMSKMVRAQKKMKQCDYLPPS